MHFLIPLVCLFSPEGNTLIHWWLLLTLNVITSHYLQVYTIYCLIVDHHWVVTCSFYPPAQHNVRIYFFVRS